jgi:hypothetical protein
VKVVRILLLLSCVPALYSQAPCTPKTTEVMAMLKLRPGVERDQIKSVMPAEIRATVRLYLDGKIRQWYSRGDGKGVIFIMDCKDAAKRGQSRTNCPW